MSIYSCFVKNVSFPILTKREGLPHLKRYLKRLEESQYWSLNKILDYQLEKIKKLLVHAYNNTAFYRKRFDDAGFNPFNFRDLDEIRKIPPLTKSDLQTYLAALVARTFTQNEIHKDATGGSTGSHTAFYRDNASLEFKKAIEYRCNKWAGWDIGEKIAYYWPALQDFAKKRTRKTRIRNVTSSRALMLYSGRLDEPTLEEHYRQLVRFRPSLMRAFPNPLAIFAKYIKESNKEKIYIPTIISVGEPLLETQRELFSNVFGTKVLNCYVSRECGNMACECGERNNHLHVNAEMVHIEFADNPNKEIFAPRTLLVTDLVNYGMPFIRYQIEDLGVSLEGECECDRKLPLMRMDAGRISDFLISPYDKSRVSGCSFLHHMIAEGPEVGQVQVLQDRIDHITLRILKSKNFSEDKLSHFDKVINSIFKGLMHYDVEYVDKISREKSGKYLFTKCLLSESQIKYHT